MEDRLRLAASVVCVLGLGVAGYLTVVHYAGTTPACGITHGCATVQSSSYAKLAGVPVALLGVLGYAAILVALWVPGELALQAAAAMAVAGLGFSCYLTYRELFDIDAICQWCVASQVLMAVLAALVVARLLRAPPSVA
jgi:uncharacterized membrane protein